MKYKVILFQPYLRRFFLNFGRSLQHGEFHNVSKPPKSKIGYQSLPNFEKEISRRKVHLIARLRRFLGIPNIRIRFDTTGDLYFTYGCLIITNKPYCVYIETGLALYNYDLGIAKNPIARILVSFLATRKNCKKLIFFSEASQKSFYSTAWYPKWIRENIRKKSIVIYPPAIEKKTSEPKKFTGSLKLLFPGTFYIKGGTEVVQAFERLRETHSNIALTIITALHMLRSEDMEHIRSVPGINILDAKLSEQEMIDIYNSHDILLLPTYREGFGLVLIEALAYGMPIIITDQYATIEMFSPKKKNGFVYPNHPLKDYNPETYQMLGKYYNPSDFYSDLFCLQRSRKMKPIEDFLVASVENFLQNPNLLEEYSRNSLALYHKKFDAKMISDQIESVFLEAIRR